MVDFDNAFKRGIQNADVVAKNMGEIDDVLHRLSEQVRVASDGAITEIVRADRTKHVRRGPVELTRDPDLLGTNRRIDYTALVAIRAANEPKLEAELCELRFAPTGYPVSLLFGKRDVACHDKGGLEKGLASLL